MKKLLCVLLIIALLVPVMAFADDPIVGVWYLLYDKSECPEMAPNFQNVDYAVCAYIFMEDGSIYLAEHDITNSISTPISSVSGKWEKSLFNYTYNIIGFGSGNAVIDKDDLLLQMQNSTVYVKLHRMIPYDPYGDYVMK